MANELTKIPKFRRCVLQNFPFIEQDFDALTDYQLLCKVVEYLNKVINSQNEVIEITESLTAAFNELQNFVENYFENLDVQEEINNKLDQMAEDGTLQEIIGSYLESNVAWTFNTVADMKVSENLVNGSYAQTTGFYTKNDGGNALYYITNTGTANEMDVIAIGSLYAVLINPRNVKQYGAYGDGIHDDTASIQRALDTIKEVYIPDGTYMVNPHADSVNEVGLKVASNSKITLSPNAEVKAIVTTYNHYAVFSIANVNNVVISGGKVTGERATHTGTTGEWGHCIAVTHESYNIILSNIKISDSWGDGVYINNAANVLTENLKVTNSRRNGISVIKADGYHSLNDVITSSNGTKPENGLDLEPNHTDDLMTNVVIENLTTKNCSGSGLNIYLLNIDNTFPVDIKVINHYDEGSLNGLALAKPASSEGLVEIIKPFYKNSQYQGIALRRCYDSNCKVIIDNPVILNANTEGDTTAQDGSAISAYLLSSDTHSTIGNIEIREPYTSNASGSVASCINISSFSDTYISNVAILNPLNSDSKYLFIDGKDAGVTFTDLYKKFELANTANLNLSISRYYSKYTNEGATGNIAITIPTGINLGRSLTVQNLSQGNRFRVFMPSGQYLRQVLDTTAGGNFYLDNLGDKITIKKISSTEWIVEEINCTPVLPV